MKHVLDQASIPETQRTCSGWSIAAPRLRSPTAVQHTLGYSCASRIFAADQICHFIKHHLHVSLSRCNHPGSKPVLGSVPLECCPSQHVWTGCFIYLTAISVAKREWGTHISSLHFPKDLSVRDTKLSLQTSNY